MLLWRQILLTQLYWLLAILKPITSRMVSIGVLIHWSILKASSSVTHGIIITVQAGRTGIAILKVTLPSLNKNWVATGQPNWPMMKNVHNAIQSSCFCPANLAQMALQASSSTQACILMTIKNNKPAWVLAAPIRFGDNAMKPHWAMSGPKIVWMNWVMLAALSIRWPQI